MTEKELLGLLKALAPVIEKHILSHVSPLAEKLAESQHRLNQLELSKSKTFLDWYRGTFQPGNTYERGLLVTADGSLFVALKDTSEKPGNSADWKMVTKRGKDGKDAVPTR